MNKKKNSTQKPLPDASRPYMPGYGLPRNTKGLLPWKWAGDRLKKSHNYWLATGRPDGAPHLMIVWGIWIENGFYFSTGSESRKAKNIAGRKNCVIGTEQADQAVIVEGLAEKVFDVDFLRRFLKLCERKYKYDMSAMAEGILSLKEPIFVVRPKVVFGLDEKRTLNSATRWKFEG